VILSAPEIRTLTGRVHLTERDEWLRHYLKQTLTSRALDDAMLFSERRPTVVVAELVRRGAPITRVEQAIKRGQGFTWAYPVKPLVAVVRAWGHAVTQNKPRAWVPAEVISAEVDQYRKRIAELETEVRAARDQLQQQENDFAIKSCRLKHEARESAWSEYQGRYTSQDVVSRTFSLMMSAHELRPVPGVYWLSDGMGAVVYVGQSKSCLSRMSGHRDKEFVTARMIRVDDESERSEIERTLIRSMRPALNIKMVSGRRPEAA
jgi:hypothetical protein